MNKKGFTIVESLVAVAILAAAVMGAMSAVQSGISSYIFSKDQITAFYLAQEGFEQLRNLRDENQLNGVHWLTGIAELNSDACAFNAACTVSPVETTATIPCAAIGSCPALRQDPVTGFFGYNNAWSQTPYRREIQLTYINDYEVAVKVIVDWTKGGATRQFTARENLFNWAGDNSNPINGGAYNTPYVYPSPAAPPPPSLAASSYNVTGHDVVTVTWSNVLPVSTTDWVSFNTAPGDYSYVSGGYPTNPSWLYTSGPPNCTKNPGAAGTERSVGSCTFTMPNIAGNYKFKIFAHNDSTFIAETLVITLTPAKILTYEGPGSNDGTMVINGTNVLRLYIPGTYTITVSGNVPVTIKGVAGGGGGGQTACVGTPCAGGAGGGGGSANMTGVASTLLSGVTLMGQDGDDTNFCSDVACGAVIMSLGGGKKGADGRPEQQNDGEYIYYGGAGGLGGVAGVGGGSNGGAGGNGGSVGPQTGFSGVSSANAAGGGGGSGSHSADGGTGGSGLSEAGGAGGSYPAFGVDKSGQGGSSDAQNAGSYGGGGGGGGVLVNGEYFGGGGGGGGTRGAGHRGIIIIQ